MSMSRCNELHFSSIIAWIRWSVHSCTRSHLSSLSVFHPIKTDHNYRYKKGISESECTVVSPTDVGGFRSEEYLAISPQGKVPSLKCQTTGRSFAESDTICRYLLSTYPDLGPSFQPENPYSNEIARFHDMYLTTIQRCLYSAAPPFGSFGTRKDALKEYSRQLYIIADLMDKEGPYMIGNEVSLADATVFPSIVFATCMFPKFEFDGHREPIPKKIEEWFQRMIDTESAFKKVHDEVSEKMVFASARLLDSCGGAFPNTTSRAKF